MLTHGHDDHSGESLAIADRFGCPALAQVELRGWLSTKGLSENAAEAMNKGGTVEVDGIKVTMTDANHPSSAYDNGVFVYLSILGSLPASSSSSRTASRSTSPATPTSSATCL